MIAIVRDILDVLFAGLWQGACLAALSGAVVAAAGTRMSAATRVCVMQCALLAIAIVPVVTTVPLVRSHTAAIGLREVDRSTAGHDGAASGNVLVALRRIDVRLDDRASIALVSLWACGAACFVLRLMAGSLRLVRLSRRSRCVAECRGVPVRASADIGVPVALGFFDRSIVVPVTLLERLEEFEAIVFHELAHVMRRDAWWNAFERMLHALLYVNPAVNIVLGRIFLEREAACDDWAVAQFRLDVYVRSLATFAVARASTPAFGAAGFAHATVARIKRLEDVRRNGATQLSPLALGGTFMLLSMIALGLQTFAPAIAFGTTARPVEVAVAACSNRSIRYLSGPPPAAVDHAKPGLVTLVRVRVSPAAGIENVSVLKSSGDASFDRSVVNAARQSHFSAADPRCARTNSYVFKARTS